MHKDLTELTLVLIESTDEGTIDDEVRVESCSYGQPLCLKLLSYYRTIMRQDSEYIPQGSS